VTIRIRSTTPDSLVLCSHVFLALQVQQTNVAFDAERVAEGELLEVKEAQARHTEDLQEHSLRVVYTAYSTIYRNVSLWDHVQGQPFAEYDTLLIRTFDDILRLQPLWKRPIAEMESFPNLPGIPGKIIYGEASDRDKNISDFCVKFESLDLRPLQLLLLVDKVAVNCAAFQPTRLSEQIDMMQQVGNLSMVTLLVGGRVQITTSNPADHTASFTTSTKKRQRADEETKIAQAAEKRARVAQQEAEEAEKRARVAQQEAEEDAKRERTAKEAAEARVEHLMAVVAGFKNSTT
jgi:hypothetical protein